MPTIMIPITLPDDLAEKAKARGLLSSSSLSKIVCEALENDEISVPPETGEYPSNFDPRLKGAVDPAMFRKGKINGDIIGPFHEEWGETS